MPLGNWGMIGGPCKYFGQGPPFAETQHYLAFCQTLHRMRGSIEEPLPSQYLDLKRVQPPPPPRYSMFSLKQPSLGPRDDQVRKRVPRGPPAVRGLSLGSPAALLEAHAAGTGRGTGHLRTSGCRAALGCFCGKTKGEPNLGRSPVLRQT